MSNLLRALWLIFLNQQPLHPSVVPIEAMYDGVLGAMNRALDSSGWPTDDASIPFVIQSEKKEAFMEEHTSRHTSATALKRLAEEEAEDSVGDESRPRSKKPRAPVAAKSSQSKKQKRRK